jgi:hypothetical protein
LRLPALIVPFYTPYRSGVQQPADCRGATVKAGSCVVMRRLASNHRDDLSRYAPSGSRYLLLSVSECSRVGEVGR